VLPNPLSTPVTDPLWYKDAVIYQLHVKAFYDANGDGIGDFAGLAQRLDYLLELGVNTLWLLPFYPSPQCDDGYDIADYRDVHPDYGTLDDFKRFIDEAHARGLKVITELVINHTSDQHPWFQAARRAAPGSPERDFYVWSDTDQKFAGTRIIFTDTESSNWAWDPLARQYYWHRFFSHQPDLNHNNPQVVDAVIQVMRFWMDIGVDGMRLDAIPYLCVREGTNNENLPETHAVLKRMRAAMDAEYTGRMFLAEANQWPEDVREYFGNGDECHVAYHFPLMPRIFMAVALEDRYPIAEILRQTPDIPENCQWAIFLRNHDELTLEMVTDRERDYMYKMYAHEPRMRVNVGIRRRLATLLGNDIDRIKLMNSLLLSMPGSPIIYYGDEIGMGDNIYIGDRNGVRTPMQWSVDRNAGFSRADPQRLYLPLIMDPIYGYQAVNVEAQGRDPSSLLNWTRRMLAIRGQHQCFGRGALEFVRPRNRKVLAYVRTFGTESILCVANLSQTAQAVELDLSKYKGRVPVELSGRNAFPPVGELPYFLTLPAHGFFWLWLSETESPPEWHVERLPATELPVLVLTDGIATLLPERRERQMVGQRTLQQLESEVLPEFLRARAWFAASDGLSRPLHLGSRAVWRSEHSTFLLTFVESQAGERVERYFLPLTLAWEDAPDSGALRTAEWTLAKIREHSRVGVLLDAYAEPAFCLALVRAVADGATIPFATGAMRFAATPAFARFAAGPLEPIRHLRADATHASVAFGEKLFLKAYRRVEAGLHPDVEMNQFLTEAGFPFVAPLTGVVEYVDTDHGERTTTLAGLFAFIGNQGDARTYAMNHLERYASALLADGEPASAPHTLYMAQMRTLGRRVGELHATLCRDERNPAFAPEAITTADQADWYAASVASVDSLWPDLIARSAGLASSARASVERLSAVRERLQVRVRELCAQPFGAARTRLHGNLHLEKLLLVADDFLIIGFEGDELRTLEERRRKDSPLHDLATLMRSLGEVRAAALERAVTARPDQRERLQTAFAEWLHEANEALVGGYLRGVGTSACLPTERSALDRLLALHLIRAALRDVRDDLATGDARLGVTADALLALALARSD
jgi:maltose alpha-D-glucosyltransferase/alpha-amylase